MTKELWINLPVKEVKKAKDFFIQIGFHINLKYPENESSACLTIGSKSIAVMLFQENLFREFTQNHLPDTRLATEVLLSFDAESREEIAALAKKVKLAGGYVFSEPAEHQGWMYGFGFADLDGHRWNAIYMDMEKLSSVKIH